MITQVKYTATQGLPWERLVIVKDKRTHRIVKPLDAWATIQVSATVKKSIPLYITSEGGIMLYLTEEDTVDLPVGDLPYDVVAVINRRSALAGGGWTSVTVPVAAGILSVSAGDFVSSLQENDFMELRFKKGADYRISVSWRDSVGNLLAVNSAYMQAKNSTGATVVDLRWFSATPTESVIVAQPATQRGYLAPYSGESLELHISDKNSVPAGTYTFDLFAQGTSSTDWVFLAGGNLVVEATVSANPT